MKQNKGITIIALVVTVIVLLIIAGVAVTFAINSNGGILDKAASAKANSSSAAIIEKWNILISESKLDKVQNENLTDDYIRTQLASSGLNFTDQEWNNFLLGQGKKIDDSKTIYYSELNNTQNNITNATLINISSSNDLTLDTGKYYINQVVDVQNTSIKIKDNATVSLIVLNNMTISDTDYFKSAIDLGKNSNFTLFANAPVTLYSGKANSGAVTQNAKAAGSLGAYAGIHVPSTAILNLSGSSATKVYGGDAGDARRCNS